MEKLQSKTTSLIPRSVQVLFSTLVTALQAAGLVETLKGKGPYTVFAPTDEAFAKIPAEDLNALLKDKEAPDKNSHLPCSLWQGDGV